jgi:hypothetical protein
VSDHQAWQRLLSLAMDALPPEQRVVAKGPGRIACDLSEAFYSSVHLEWEPVLRVPQREVFSRLDDALRDCKARTPSAATPTWSADLLGRSCARLPGARIPYASRLLVKDLQALHAAFCNLSRSPFPRPSTSAS